MVGVAGSLRPEHVAPLLALRPDVIGFRGALCHGGRRDAELDPIACSQIRALISAEGPQVEAQIGAPRPAAVC